MVSPGWSLRKNAWASASSTRKPSTYQTAPPGAARGPVRRSAERRFLEGGCDVSAMYDYKRILRRNSGLGLVERQRAGLDVDVDDVALAEVSLQDPDGQRIEDPALDRALQRPRAVGRI